MAAIYWHCNIQDNKIADKFNTIAVKTALV